LRLASLARPVAAVLLILALGGCSRHEQFLLPSPQGPRQSVSWEWRPNADPLIQPGPGEIDVLAPAMARGLLFYSVFDGKTWHTALEGQRVLSPTGGWEGHYISANGAILWRNGRFEHWYHAAGPETARIGFAWSADGRAWQRHPQPVLDLGPRGAWDERGTADPYVIESQGQLYLFYLGQDRARRQRLGIARSADGITWTKLLSNPVLDLGDRGAFDERGLGEPAVWVSHGSWWMLYTGRDRAEMRRIGLARSADGVRWEKAAGWVIAGDRTWNAKTICDPHVEPQSDGTVKVWFGGGAQAHPAERVNGKIGVGVLVPRP
jgi:hypothetical protein